MVRRKPRAPNYGYKAKLYRLKRICLKLEINVWKMYNFSAFFIENKFFNSYHLRNTKFQTVIIVKVFFRAHTS